MIISQHIGGFKQCMSSCWFLTVGPSIKIFMFTVTWPNSPQIYVLHIFYQNIYQRKCLFLFSQSFYIKVMKPIESFFVRYKNVCQLHVCVEKNCQPSNHFKNCNIVCPVIYNLLYIIITSWVASDFSYGKPGF